MEHTMQVGTTGEARVREFFRSAGWEVEDLSVCRKYQEQDIDMRVCKPGSVPFTVEVKTDTIGHKTRNIFIEIMMERASGQYPGWMYYCNAHVLCYLLDATGTAYFLDWAKIRRMVEMGKGRSTRFKNPYDENCIGHGRLLNIEQDLRPSGVILLEKKIFDTHASQ